MLLAEASKEFKWNLDYGAIAMMWRGGCKLLSPTIKVKFDLRHYSFSLSWSNKSCVSKKSSVDKFIAGRFL